MKDSPTLSDAHAAERGPGVEQHRSHREVTAPSDRKRVASDAASDAVARTKQIKKRRRMRHVDRKHDEAAGVPICEDVGSARGAHEDNNNSTTQCSLCSSVPLPPLRCMTRGQQDVYGWWRKNSSGKILGHLRDCMESLVEHCLLSVQGLSEKASTLRVLSLSDGCVNDERVVPSSVLLARAFASLDKSIFPPDLKWVKIVGADVRCRRRCYYLVFSDYLVFLLHQY